VPAAKSGEGAGGAGGKVKGDSLFGSILKEEEELEMIKSLPADSALRFHIPTSRATHHSTAWPLNRVSESQDRSIWRT
jgi:hypothetical protein